MTFRAKVRGAPSGHLPPTAFVAFLQNHDQIGNRPFGDRLAGAVSQRALRAATAVYLLLPQIPMLFMGEEWNALQPFPFFCDFESELADKVRVGRREEFSSHPDIQDPEQLERIPDPQAAETFMSGKLCWEDLAELSHCECLEWYRGILSKRRESITPLLRALWRGGDVQQVSDGAVLVRWQSNCSAELVLAANSRKGRWPGFRLYRSRSFGRKVIPGTTAGPFNLGQSCGLSSGREPS